MIERVVDRYWNVILGMAQGSILGPLLLMLYSVTCI